jgi:prepilin-type processing-associated H-X9-DG protein
MMNYEGIYGSLPAGQKGCCWGTWIVFILPTMEQTASFNCWNFNGDNSVAGAAYGTNATDLRYGGAANTTISQSLFSVYLCPSDQQTKPLGGIPSFNYAANFGNTTYYQIASTGSGANLVNYLAAPFSDMWPSTASNGGPKGYTVSQYGTVPIARITDGTSNTILVSEAVQGESHGSKTDLRGFAHWGYAASFETNITPNSPLPDVLWGGYCQYPYGTNPPCILQAYAKNTVLAARSRHPGGVNTVFGDGHVQFVKNSVSLPIWRALGSIQGGEVISADSY